METKEKARKTYKKPQINQVRLVIEDAVLAGCKVTVDSTGQDNKLCNHQKCQYTQGS